jgi:putative ABC transport system ATP-binding protein
MRVEAHAVSLVYDIRSGPPVIALDDVNLAVAGGTFTGILGPSGSGKSSLLHVMSGLKTPSAGTVFLDDADLSLWSADQLDHWHRHHCGFIFQRHYLLAYLNLLDNVLLPLAAPMPADRQRACALLEQFGLAADATRYPHELSVGERQLVAVARALINRPDFVFADEPTAALDLDTALKVMTGLSEYSRQAAVVVVTHDFKMLRHANPIILLRDGRVQQANATRLQRPTDLIE